MGVEWTKITQLINAEELWVLTNHGVYRAWDAIRWYAFPGANWTKCWTESQSTPVRHLHSCEICRHSYPWHPFTFNSEFSKLSDKFSIKYWTMFNCREKKNIQILRLNWILQYATSYIIQHNASSVISGSNERYFHSLLSPFRQLCDLHSLLISSSATDPSLPSPPGLPPDACT